MGGWDAVRIVYTLFKDFCKELEMRKNGVDHQDNKFPIDVVQVLILFKEGHRGQLKLHVHLGEGVLVLEKKGRNFLRGRRKTYGRLFRNY